LHFKAIITASDSFGEWGMNP